MRDQIGRISGKPCQWCRGLGRKWAEYGSGEHRMAANIGAMGLYPGIRKGHSKYNTGETKLGRR